MSQQQARPAWLVSRLLKLKKSPTKTLVLDGGTGEELMKLGLVDDRKSWSGAAFRSKDGLDLLKEVHKSFLHAGSDAITTNTYALTHYSGFSKEEIVQFCKEACKIGRESIVEAGKPDALLLGSLPPLTESYRPDLIATEEKCIEDYLTMIQAMDVDCYLCETISTTKEAIWASEALKKSGKKLPFWCSWTLNGNGTLRSGEDVATSVKVLIEHCKANDVNLQAVLFNCCVPEVIDPVLKTLKKLDMTEIAMGAYPNILTPIADDWSMAEAPEPQGVRQDISTDALQNFVKVWVDSGIDIVGLCCGGTPCHIKSLAEI